MSEHIHLESPGHQVDINGEKVFDKENSPFERGVKEAIYIRAYQPTLNRNAGRHQLSHMYNNILRTEARKLNNNN